MTNKKNETGAILSAEAHARLKVYGPVSTLSSLILSCLSRQLPETGTQLKESLCWSPEQIQRTVEELGSEPFPLTGNSLYRVANQDQLRSLEGSTLFEQISLEFFCLRQIRGKITSPQVSRETGVGLTLRLDIQARNWWAHQFTNTQPGISHILMAAIDWIILTFDEDVLVRLEKHSDLLHLALANATIPPETNDLTWMVKSKLQVFAQGDFRRGNFDDLLQILDEEINEFIYLCLIIKYGYGNLSKVVVSPRISVSTIDHMVKLFGNKNTGVAFAAETFPHLYHATMHEEVQRYFETAELEDLAEIARINKIGPPENQYPGMALRSLAMHPQAAPYKDRIELLSTFGSLCMEVAVISCHYIRQGPAIAQKKAKLKIVKTK